MWEVARLVEGGLDHFSLNIHPDKISKYLLNADHPQGRAKAKFLISRGFVPGRPNDLAVAIAFQAFAATDIVCRRHPRGHYRVDARGPIQAPDRTSPIVTTGWDWFPRPSGTLPERRTIGTLKFSTLLPR